ncbi:UPF0280 family protein [Maribellus comscasis]|uniref:UPF0280 family protein n=1 Tax=Maribellus comscasis TaxID=2681766 RepID=A0A6I6K044_9BACT|nr:UPF0280 family protein [Maribellus comscasis]QGY44753.1 UPF0280 family protein [Maribellus comscasis]
MFEERTYRTQFNTGRFTGFEVEFKETDLWIGVNPDSFKPEMKEIAFSRIKSLRKKLDEYIKTEPFFKKSLKPFHPSENAPPEAKEMASTAEKAGIGPMATVAGLFAREIGKELKKNFQTEEIIVENGGDIFALLNKELVLSVFAGNSPLSERIGLAIPDGMSEFGICTSAGTIGPSFSAGKADAVVVICDDVVLADAFATAFGNKVKSPNDVEKVINMAEKYPEIKSLLIICEDQIGIRGDFEIRLLK